MNNWKSQDCDAHQEAHEVESEYGGHSSEGQALEHGAADPGRIAVVLGVVDAGVGAGAGLRGRAALYFTAPSHHEQN